MRRRKKLSPEARALVVDRLGRMIDSMHAYARLYPDLPDVTRGHREAADYLSEIRKQAKR